MLSALSSHLAARRVILASQSPRRLELLRECRLALDAFVAGNSNARVVTAMVCHDTSQGLTFEVIPSTFEENLPKEQFASPELYVIENAKQKALEVMRRTNVNAAATTSITSDAQHVVIGCDTVVVHAGAILEKPRDEQDAFTMLSKLSGATHEVYSGVALFTSALGEQEPHLFFEKTTVTFGPLEPEDIRAYIRTGEPMDKAGAYGIQGRARCFIEALSGCHNNVMGFPVQRFCKELKLLAASDKL